MCSILFYPKSKQRLVEVGFTHLKILPLASSLVALEFLCTICNPVCLQGGLGTDSLMSQCNEREYCDNQSSKHQRRAAHAAFLLNYSHNLVSRRKNKSGNSNKFTWRHLLKFKYIRCKYAQIGQASGFYPLENRNAIFTFEFGTYLWILNFVGKPRRKTYLPRTTR